MAKRTRLPQPRIRLLFAEPPRLSLPLSITKHPTTGPSPQPLPCMRTVPAQNWQALRPNRTRSRAAHFPSAATGKRRPPGACARRIRLHAHMHGRICMTKIGGEAMDAPGAIGTGNMPCACSVRMSMLLLFITCMGRKCYARAACKFKYTYPGLHAQAPTPRMLPSACGEPGGPDAAASSHSRSPSSSPWRRPRHAPR